jgi:hypothetical protein
MTGRPALMGGDPALTGAEARLSEAAADLRRWPADELARRQQLNDRLGRSLEQLASAVRSLSERLGDAVT